MLTEQEVGTDDVGKYECVCECSEEVVMLTHQTEGRTYLAEREKGDTL